MYNNQSPLISIITPCYNSEKFISQAIESVLAQTFQNWELIIIDDCSTDGSYEIILSYVKKDNRIKVYKMEQNSGVAICRNKAIEFSKGEYLSFLDSDDLWLPEKVEKQLRFMQKNNCDFCFTEYEIIDEHKKPLDIKVRVIKKLTYKKMLFCCFTGCLTVMYKQDQNNKVFIPKVGNGIEDYVLFLNILKHINNACGLSECLAQYRKHRKSLSGNRLNKLKKIKYYIEVMTKNEHKNIFITLFYLSTWHIINIFWKYKKYYIKSKNYVKK